MRDDWRAVSRHLDGMLNTRDEFLRVRALTPETLSPQSAPLTSSAIDIAARREINLKATRREVREVLILNG